MPDRIVLFGGTFDPVHHGHLIVARSLAEQLGTAVTLVPASIPPHKPGPHASAEDRLAMLRLAVQGENVFEICDLELLREGPSYTIDTIKHLGGHFGPGVRLSWVIGTDMLADLPKWQRADELMELVDFLVVRRAPWQQDLEVIFRRLGDSFSPDQVQRLRQSVVATPIIEISSSDIRDRVGAGLSIRYMVPEAVAGYIEDMGLYG